MLGVGIDWAEQFHLVAVGRGENGVFEVTRVQHPPAVAALVARIVGLEPDPAEVRVVIETSPRGAGGATAGHRVHGGSGEPGPGREAHGPD